jgi:hypothetical protein
MSIEDRIVLGLDLIMYYHMLDLWGPENLIACVTTWASHNRFSKVVVGGRMR